MTEAPALPGDVALEGIRRLIAEGRGREARIAWRGALARFRSPVMLHELHRLLPRLFEGWPRTAALLALERRLAAAGEPATMEDRWALATVGLGIRLALGDHAGFLERCRTAGLAAMPGDLAAHLRAIAGLLAQPGFPDAGRPRIFGIGLSRTGTKSLTAALTLLGHRTAHWLNPLTHEIVDLEDAWLFDACTDISVCVELERWYHLFPNARFIYTTRPLAAWRASFEVHLRRLFGGTGFPRLRALLATGGYVESTRFAEIHRALYFEHAAPEEAWRAYDARVRGFFRDKPAARFLELDVFAGQGWPELCEFLGAAPPDVPYPRENQTPAELRGG